MSGVIYIKETADAEADQAKLRRLFALAQAFPGDEPVTLEIENEHGDKIDVSLPPVEEGTFRSILKLRAAYVDDSSETP